MKRIQHKTLSAFLAVIIFFPFCLYAQSNDSTVQKLITLRDNFINRIRSCGFNPSLPPPKIILDNPRSFGNYDNIENILHTTDWETLPPEAKGLFQSLASQIGNGEMPIDVFEKGTHEWIFIHELGHWWRACQHQTALPYDGEMAANRIAMAFWREQDTALMNFQLNIFKGFIAHIPSPVPAGQSKRNFLNNNYNKLPGGPAYTWFQSEMIVDGYNEKPILSFKQAITNSGKK